MPQDFDISHYSELLHAATVAFLADSAYAIAIAKPAGNFAARQKLKQESDELADSSL